MIDEVYAVYVGGEPAKRIMQIFSTSGRGPILPHGDLGAMPRGSFFIDF